MPLASSLAIHGGILTVAGFIAVGAPEPEREVVIDASAPDVVACDLPEMPPSAPSENVSRPAQDRPDDGLSIAPLPDPFEPPPPVAPGTEAAPVLAFAKSLLSQRFAPPSRVPAGPATHGETTDGAHGAHDAHDAHGGNGGNGGNGASGAAQSNVGGTDRECAASASPPLAAPGSPTTTGGGVSRSARFRETPARPDYPSVARRRGWQGRVLLSISIDADGVVADVTVAQSSGRNALDEAAVEGAFRWRFEPALDDGRAVASTVEKAVEFRLVD